MDLIIGGGKYGCNAAELLRKNNRDFIVVDPNPDCLAVKRFGLKTSRIPQKGEHLILGDLSNALSIIESLKPEFVFPTAPVHIVAEMAKIKFNLTPWLDVIDCILPRLPQSVVLSAGRGGIILSFNRDAQCQEYCSMPEICPATRIKKPCTMTRLMQYASPEAYILISRPMAPGIGALKGAEILSFFDWAKNQEELIIGTACNCHGVFSAFKNNVKTTN